MRDCLGLLETTGLTPAMAALDVMEKASGVSVVQAEINDFLGVVIKLSGSLDDVQTAIDAGQKVAEQLGGKPIVGVIARVDEEAWRQAILSPAEYNPLIQQPVVTFPDFQRISEDGLVSHPHPDALGFIETQGFTAVFEAIDTACKAANVEVIGKEKLGGGYVTVVISGDVAAVNSAIEAGRAKVEGLGNLIAAHVVTRPSKGVLGLLPQVAK